MTAIRGATNGIGYHYYARQHTFRRGLFFAQIPLVTPSLICERKLQSATESEVKAEGALQIALTAADTAAFGKYFSKVRVGGIEGVGNGPSGGISDKSGNGAKVRLRKKRFGSLRKSERTRKTLSRSSARETSVAFA